MSWWRWTREWLRRLKAEAQRLPHVGQETLPLEDREACACRWWRIWRRPPRSLFRLASNVSMASRQVFRQTAVSLARLSTRLVGSMLQSFRTLHSCTANCCVFSMICLCLYSISRQNLSYDNCLDIRRNISGQNLSYDNCLDIRRENNHKCSMLYCVQQLCTMIRTYMWKVLKFACRYMFKFCFCMFI